MPTSGPGLCYLLHFDGPFGHAGHYLGFCESDLETRLRYHLAGRGSRLVKAAVEAGIDVYLVRLWKGASRDDERRLKGHSSTRYCPVCSDPDVSRDGFGPRWLTKKLADSKIPLTLHDSSLLDEDEGGAHVSGSLGNGSLGSCGQPSTLAS